jgi:hypothetical protein
MLRSGLVVVDTPGVGGLESVHGQLTLATLSDADSVLFVTDAGQELTGPELEFLKTTIQRCASAALVVTKTDIYPEWRRIVDLDIGHLRDAAIQVPVLPVSSFLRLRAARQPALNEESGFRRLVEHLATVVVVPGTAKAAAEAARDADFVASQLAHEADAERVVLAKPAEEPAVVSQLQRARDKAVKLGAASASWQQTLSDGIQDLVADVEHDLHGRLRGVLRDVEAVIDEGDPKDSWPDIELWLRRQVTVAGMENRDLILSRARELSDSVAKQFDLEAGTGIEVELAGVTQALEQLELAPAASGAMAGGRLGSLVITARISMLVPVILYSVGSILLPGAGLAMAGVGAAMGAGIGGKLFKDESKRQRTTRRQQAKGTARKFVDDVGFVLTKETRDGLRAVQRQLRDDFHNRASVMQRSTAAALEAAQRATQLTPATKAVRVQQVEAETTRLQAVRSSLREFAVGAAPATVVGGAMLGATMVVGGSDGSEIEAPGAPTPDTVIDDHG